MTQTDQAECPNWARYVPLEDPPADYTNSPPGPGRGWRLCEMAEGDEAWIIASNVFRDNRGNLWADGAATTGHLAGDQGAAHVVRTADGIRVLAWPSQATIKEQRPNRYAYRDVWVVEFPAGPVSCRLCGRLGQPEDFKAVNDGYECLPIVRVAGACRSEASPR